MAKLEDLKEVLKETLENRGVLGQVRARIRAEVFNALDEPSEMKPTLSNENFLINELIREYLEFNKYKYTSSVLTVETGQPKDPMDRRYLIQELNIDDDSEPNKIPILYGLLSHFLQRGKSSSKAAFETGERRAPGSNKEPTNFSSSEELSKDDDIKPKRDYFITYKN